MRIRSRTGSMLALAVVALSQAPRARAQGNTPSGTQASTPGAAPGASPPVGAMAPDFTLPGATRYGVLKAPVHLSDYRGQTVVLAFFYQARTKG
jgi:hypothetical protein